jgi:hypothetical protein
MRRLGVGIQGPFDTRGQFAESDERMGAGRFSQ